LSYLVDEFKKDHSVITETLTNIRALGVTSEKGQKMLLAAKSSFLAHLKKEDEHLYPVLKKAAESDVNLKQTLDTFATDMDEVTKGALDFFDKYSTGGSGREFAKDFGKLMAALSIRIRKEETILYQKYNVLNQ